jgi:group I intron endonuclease
MIYGYIYKTTNLINNKIYIGKREGKFSYNYFGSGILLNRAIKKYGKNNFIIEMIACAKDEKHLNELEKVFILKYRKILGRDKLYNLADGGEGGALYFGYGRTLSKETKDKISLALKGRKKKPFSNEHKEKIRLCKIGTISTKKGKTFEEFYGEERAKIIKEKIRQKLIGKKQSIETIIKKHNAMVGRKQSLEHIQKRVNSRIKRRLQCIKV